MSVKGTTFHHYGEKLTAKITDGVLQGGWIRSGNISISLDVLEDGKVQVEVYDSDLDAILFEMEGD